MSIFRVTARWSGFPGAPGYSNFHFTGSTPGDVALGERERVRAFFSRVTARLASGTIIEIDPVVTEFDETTGQMIGMHLDEEELEPLESSGSGSYAGPAGAVVNWRTQTVNNGRLVRGRTFLVPIAGSAFDSDGTLSTAALSQFRGAAEELSGADFETGFCIWSRPTDGGTGAVAPVVSHDVPDMVAVLRSRRD